MDDNLRTQLQFESSKKSTGVSYLLWFFLGSFGAHRFYLGRNGSAIGQLAMFLLGFLTFMITWIALGIWWVVDAFLIPQMIEQENAKLIERLDAGNRLSV